MASGLSKNRANGMVLTQTVNGQTTSFEYDNMGRQTKVTVPGNVVTNTAYYLTGEIRRIDGATYPVEYTYNGLGNQATMTTFKDADTPQQTSWSYNSRGQMIAKTYADNSSVAYTYNGDGQLLTRTWARQANGAPLVTSYTYDAAGRQTGYSYSDGTTPAVTQTLNFLDQPVTVTDAAGTRNFTYNTVHRLVNETIPGIVNGVINYTYDAYGRRTAMSLSNGTTTFANANYTYGAAGRIATVGNNADTLTYTYMPGTNIIGSSAWQNAALNTVNTYDSYKRLTNIAVNGVNVYGYTLNDKNQRTGATLPDGNTWSYDYDAMGQLTGAVKQSSGNTQLAGMSWFYDQIGNRTSATENNVTTSYISNLVNQYTQIASQLPTYDADGNMLTCNGWTFTWNGENRLIAAESSDTRLEFSYDYMGRRLEKKVYTKGLFTLYDWSLVKHHKFVYDGYKLIAEFDVLDADAQPVSYLWQPVGLDVPLMRTTNEVNGYYVADGNKNIIAVRDSNGTELSNYTYTPFGTVENPEDSDDNPFRFSSEYHDDETGLVYYNYRYYSPELGRWIKRDPAEEQGGVNLYVMIRNNCMATFDVNGLYVKASFSTIKQTLTVSDDKMSISMKAMSGGTWVRSAENNTLTFVPNEENHRRLTYKDANGPTIPDTYYLVKHSKPEWYGLKNRYTLSYRYSYYRVGFFIHKGTFSQGCITIPLMDNVEVAKYNRFVEMMESTTPKRITKYIPWRVTICSLGEITVSL